MLEQDISIYRGDDTAVTFTITDANNRPYDLSSYAVTMLIKPKGKDTYLLKEGAGIDVRGNQIAILFSHDLTKNWTFKTAIYDIQIVDSVGLYKTIVKGNIEVEMDVTP